MMETPVLFLIFNRPETTAQVFAKLRQSKPKYLYIAADGPRKEKPDETELCDQARDFVLNNIDWPCEVKTLFREKNLGCGKAVSEAITWFFNEVEEGIILEDDCLPDLSFFTFCKTLLDKYRNEKKVWAITGVNFQDGIQRGNASYYFSFNNHVWGWASWRDRWEKYKFSISPDINVVKRYLDEPKYINHYMEVFGELGEIDTWDFQWLYCMWENDGLAAVPNQNLISNLGFTTDATHTKTPNEFAYRDTLRLDEVTFEENIERSEAADEYILSLMFPRKPSYFQRFCNKMLLLLNQSYNKHE